MPNHSADDVPPTSRPFGSSELGLVQRVRAFLDDRFGASKPHLIVGYSGGADSLALLLLVRELARVNACSIVAVHVDHRLRDEAEQDAQRAASICRPLGVDVMIKRSSDHPAKLFPGVGIEEASRRVRFESFRDVASDLEADAVLLGHHARDQAETVLLHLMRGSGLHGLAGMADDTVLEVPWWAEEDQYRLRVLRPLLTEHPDDLRRVADQSGLPIIEDRSNNDPAFRRNRVRHELLPLMEGIAPGTTGRLVSLADIVQEDEAALDNVASITMRSSLFRESLVWMYLQHAPTGVQRRVIRLWLLEFAEVEELSRERVDAVMALANRRVGSKRVEIGGGWSVTVNDGLLYLVAPRGVSR